MYQLSPSQRPEFRRELYALTEIACMVGGAQSRVEPTEDALGEESESEDSLRSRHLGRNAIEGHR